MYASSYISLFGWGKFPEGIYWIFRIYLREATCNICLKLSWWSYAGPQRGHRPRGPSWQVSRENYRSLCIFLVWYGHPTIKFCNDTVSFCSYKNQTTNNREGMKIKKKKGREKWNLQPSWLVGWITWLYHQDPRNSVIQALLLKMFELKSFL